MSRRAGLYITSIIVTLTFVLPSIGFGDARTERLVELLRNSGNYRVRVQSAQSLGRIRDPQTVPPLIEALRDRHPAVRAASALALGRIGSPEALVALQRLARDSNQPQEVISQANRAIQQIRAMTQMNRSSQGKSSGQPVQTRFYIGVGEMGNTTKKRSGELEKTLARMVRSELSKADGVKLAPAREPLNKTKRILKAKGWTGFYIQGSVTRLELTGGKIHAVVSIMVLSNPGRDLRMMLQGRGIATVHSSGSLSSGQRRNLEDSALEGAVRGAMTRLAQTLRSRP